MQKRDAIQMLKELILRQEASCLVESILLKEQFRIVVESLKPVNLIKNVFASTDLKNSVVDNAIGMTSGYVVRKAIVRTSKNLFLKLLGTIVGIGVSKVVSKNPAGIKSVGKNILNALFNKEEDTIENA